MEKYIIYWKSKTDDEAGHGTEQFDYKEAMQIVAEANRELGDTMYHWLEPVPAENENEKEGIE